MQQARRDFHRRGMGGGEGSVSAIEISVLSKGSKNPEQYKEQTKSVGLSVTEEIKERLLGSQVCFQLSSAL
jgi:hypothetical protein